MKGCTVIKGMSLKQVQGTIEEAGRMFAKEAGTPKDTLKILILPDITSEQFRRSVERLAAKM